MRNLLTGFRPLAVALLIGLLAFGACSDDDDGGGGAEATGPDTAEPAGDDAADEPAPDDADGIVIADFAFSSVAVAPDSEVSVTNEDDAPHTVTADDGSFDSGRIESGQSAAITAPTEPGEHPFHCEIHPDMTGSITVEG